MNQRQHGETILRSSVLCLILEKLGTFGLKQELCPWTYMYFFVSPRMYQTPVCLMYLQGSGSGRESGNVTVWKSTRDKLWIDVALRFIFHNFDVLSVIVRCAQGE